MIDKFKAIADKYDFLTPSLLSEIPDGWLDMVDKMAAEIQEEIEKSGIDDYEVFQTKEKYGFLHWYDAGIHGGINEIIRKYEDISERTCCGCGKPATKISLGWICPWCDECAKKVNGKFKNIE